MRDAQGRAIRVVQRLGQGVVGEVVLARIESPSGPHPVALQWLPDHLELATPVVATLRDDLRRLATLDHPVLPPTEVVEIEGKLALTTRHVASSDLVVRIHAREPLPPGPLLDVIEQVADALYVAWSDQRLVHGDVRPRYIRVGVHGSVELLDFGVDRVVAPEPWDATPADDVFALGCILFEAWTRNPFLGGREDPLRLGPADTPETYGAFLGERLSRPGIEPIADLLYTMLAFDPADRPSALQVTQRCEEIAFRLDGSRTLVRWARDRRAESGPTQRVAPVDSGAIDRLLDDSDAPTSVTLPTLSSLPTTLGPETPPSVPQPLMGDVLPPGPVDPRPAPLDPSPNAASQATTRWMAPVTLDDDESIPDQNAAFVAAVLGTLIVAGGGLAFAATYLTGALDAFWP